MKAILLLAAIHILIVSASRKKRYPGSTNYTKTEKLANTPGQEAKKERGENFYKPGNNNFLINAANIPALSK